MRIWVPEHEGLSSVEVFITATTLQCQSVELCVSEGFRV